MRDSVVNAIPYRGYVIVEEVWSGETIVWVGTMTGPFDSPSVERAKQYIDALIEEEEEEEAQT